MGVAYTSTCTAAGGKPPYSFLNNTPPAGLSVFQTTATTVTISGTPTQAGNYSFVVIAEDAANPKQSLTNTFTGTLSAAVPFTFTCNPSTGPTTVGVFYTTTCTATGGTPPLDSYAEVLALPAGLQVQPTNANLVTISGTPTQAGDYSFRVFASDSASPPQSRTVTFTGTQCRGYRSVHVYV